MRRQELSMRPYTELRVVQRTKPWTTYLMVRPKRVMLIGRYANGSLCFPNNSGTRYSLDNKHLMARRMIAALRDNTRGDLRHAYRYDDLALITAIVAELGP